MMMQRPSHHHPWSCTVTFYLRWIEFSPFGECSRNFFNHVSFYQLYCENAESHIRKTECRCEQVAVSTAVTLFIISFFPSFAVIKHFSGCSVRQFACIWPNQLISSKCNRGDVYECVRQAETSYSSRMEVAFLLRWYKIKAVQISCYMLVISRQAKSSRFSIPRAFSIPPEMTLFSRMGLSGSTVWTAWTEPTASKAISACRWVMGKRKFIGYTVSHRTVLQPFNRCWCDNWKRLAAQTNSSCHGSAKQSKSCGSKQETWSAECTPAQRLWKERTRFACFVLSLWLSTSTQWLDPTLPPSRSGG